MEGKICIKCHCWSERKNPLCKKAQEINGKCNCHEEEK